VEPKAIGATDRFAVEEAACSTSRHFGASRNLVATGAKRTALGKHPSGADRRQRALAIIAAEIGAIAVARATAKSHPRLSKEVLIGVRRVLGEVGGEARRSPRKTPISRKTRLAKSGRAITLR